METWSKDARAIVRPYLRGEGWSNLPLLLGTYRIDHEGKVSLKPPFRIHSNKKAGIKPKLVPSIVFKEAVVWDQIEKTIKSELSKEVQAIPKNKRECLQLDFFQECVERKI